jgi:hypothetical protein
VWQTLDRAGSDRPWLNRHSGLDPESMNTVAGELTSPVFMDPGFRRDDEKPDQPEPIML